MAKSKMKKKYIYSVKYFCSLKYSTRVNVHNFLEEDLSYEYKYVNAFHEKRPFPIPGDRRKVALGPNAAQEHYVCGDLMMPFGIFLFQLNATASLPHLSNNKIPAAIKSALTQGGYSLSNSASVQTDHTGQQWRIIDNLNGVGFNYMIHKDGDDLLIYLHINWHIQEGFLVVESSKPLAVVAIYTCDDRNAIPDDFGPKTCCCIDVEYISPHIVKEEEDGKPPPPPKPTIDFEKLCKDIGKLVDKDCPCKGPKSGGKWKNHGEYINCVKAQATQLLAAHVPQLTKKQSDKIHKCILKARAKNDCGKKKKM